MSLEETAAQRGETDKIALNRRNLFATITGGAAFVLLPGSAQAAWPDRIVRIVVPFGAGSSSDTIARIIAAKLGEKLGQQFIVENRVGGATILGTNTIAKAAPDGYTLGLANTSTHAATAAVYNDLPFDATKDFTPIGMIGSSPFLLIGSPKLPAKTLKDFAAMAKAAPGKYSYASAGTGTLTHLAGELVKWKLGIQVTHIPYRGTEQSVADLLTGRIDMIVATIPPVLGQIREGDLKPYAVMSTKRVSIIPDIPTIGEAGAPGCEAALWSALVAPAGLPADVTRTLNQALGEIVNSKDVQETFRTQGVTPEPGSPEATAETIRNDIVRWKQVANEANIHLKR
ncbi:MAG: tripartite tricarboxylate transporter substrate binding protein [Pseudolabrys sp.]|nr:tripartite tricarboxylate transporter substrate binding protein [Pseudolabrys sp.]